MQPRFALRITDDGLALLDRTAAGWVEVGTTVFDRPDLDAAVSALAGDASVRAPKGFATLLVLPDSQILYTQVADAGEDAATQRERIRLALDGRTPYDVSELVFDWTMAGTTAHVAVVARETLDEAEAFAAARGLNPVGFAASPAAGLYPALPAFGTTALAATLLKRGRTLAPETAPVVAQPQAAEAGDTRPDSPPEVPAPPAEPKPEPAPEPGPAEEPTPTPLTEPPPATPAEVPEPPAEPGPQPEPLPIPVYEPEPVHEPEPLPVPVPDPGPDPTPDPVPEPLDVPGFDPMPDPVIMQKTATGGASVLNPGIAEVDEAPMALDVPVESEPPRPRPRGALPPIDDVPPAPTAAASLAFASRRDVAASVAGNPARPLGAASRPLPSPTAKPAVTARPMDRPAGVRPPPKLGYADPVEPKESLGLRGLGAFVTAPVLPGRGKRKVVTAPATDAPAAAATKAATAAVRPAAKPVEFRGRPEIQRGKPRYLGLILTGVLLVFLAIAAALSSYFVTETDPAADAGPAPTQESAVESAATAPVTATTEVAGEARADGEEPDAPAVAAEGTPPPAPATEAATTSVPPAVDAATVAAAVTPNGTAQDEITLSAADTAPQALDARALPLPGARGDPPPAAQVPPPPFGTVYQFDENGLIRPTPEGIVSPEGVLLVAGRPARVPPPRPEGLAPVTAPAAAATAETTPSQSATGFPADPALADARPQRRPEGLVPAPEVAPDDQTNLIPAAARFVSLRPLARPDTILAAGLQAQQAALAASASLVAPDPNRSVLALSVSRRPAARPADMARAVEAAVAAAARQPEPEPMPAPADEPPAEVTPETEEEPEVASAAPAIPATANVARQATMRNAINLSDLNLIGIYGTQSDRYALVRQPNGRFVEVRVGDRLDGGRVAAITASEVRYEKRGRMQVLEMPRG